MEKEVTWKSPYLGAGPGLIKVKDMWMPKLYLQIEPDKMEKIASFQAREDDIWLCSYPKSGTSWLQQIIYLLKKGDSDEETKNKNSDERFPYLEGIVPVVDKLNAICGQRMIKSHLTIDVLPESVLAKKAKVIYISRNVKDVSVSMYHFHQLVTNIDYKGTFANFYQEFIEGKVCYGDWWNHVAGFWKHRTNDNVLFIKYEDIHKDNKKEIQKIADFLGITYEQSQIERISQLSMFNSMKSNPMANQSWQVDRGIYKSDSGHNFLRKGKVGDWKNYYSDEMSQEVDSITEKTVKPLALEFQYDISE